jgi:glutamyl-tRNA synthetase
MAKNSSTVRVRFAPSPTGLQHIGGMRSALFNYLYARHEGGKFIVRLEDTDRERFIPEAEQHLFDSLQWLGITPDESNRTGGDYGPYTQSKRLEIYTDHANQLTKTGALYACWCSPERLTALREQAQTAKKPFKYDRHCLNHPRKPSEPHVLRFHIPDEPTTITWNDLVVGRVEVESQTLDDFVCVKSDGFPTYHFANVVDDQLMKISHVMRAAEWLSSTPKHILLYQAFNWIHPQFVHLPQILGPDGKRKLSKRDGAKDLLDYAKEGYLQEALMNFMALLGWNEGSGTTQEIYSLKELIKAFSPERIQKSPAVFDPERLIWMNGHYIRSLSIEALGERATNFWPESAQTTTKDYKVKVLGLIQERLKYLAELPELTDFFFTDPDPKAAKILLKVDPKDVREYLEAAAKSINSTTFTHNELETSLRQLADTLGAKPGPLFGALRVAITGKTAAPGLFETMTVLGKETVLRRLKAASKTI